MEGRSPPIAELLEALQRRQAADASEPPGEVTRALEDLIAQLRLRGLWIETDAENLPRLAVGAGSLRDGPPSAEGTPLTGPWEHAALGRIFVDGGEAGGLAVAQHSVALALEAVRAEARARRAERRLEALDTAVRGISGVLDLERVFQLIVDQVRELAEAEYAALGIVDVEGQIERFVASGIDAETRRRIGHLPRGRGLLGLIIRENRSYRVRDIGGHPDSYGFPDHHPPMSSFLGVPVTVGGQSIGRLYLTNKRTAPEFSPDDESLVEMFALHAGIAVESAQLHEQVQRLAVVEERDRISRDLHDSIIQSIYAVTLSLDDVLETVEDTSDEARERVDEAIDALHGVIRDIRNFIFGLRPILLEEGGLRAGLDHLAKEIRRGAAVEVEVQGDDVPELQMGTVAELLAVVREALSNVARHASASRVALTCQSGPAGVRLEIADDGRGFDPAAARVASHHGLANMRARVEALGGTFDVESAPEAGTRIILVLPPVAGGTQHGGEGP
jgi:signal transduction histidine kinase